MCVSGWIFHGWAGCMKGTFFMPLTIYSLPEVRLHVAYESPVQLLQSSTETETQMWESTCYRHSDHLAWPCFTVMSVRFRFYQFEFPVSLFPTWWDLRANSTHWNYQIKMAYKYILQTPVSRQPSEKGPHNSQLNLALFWTSAQSFSLKNV